MTGRRVNSFDETLSDELAEELGKELSGLEDEIEEDLELEIKPRREIKVEKKSDEEDLEDFFSDGKKKDNKKPKTKRKKKKVKIMPVLILILIVLVIGIVVGIKILTPTIKLSGDKKVELTVNSEYIDSGAKAKYISKDVSKDIKVENKVKLDKPGDYVITYSIKKGLFKKSVKRTVKVYEKGPTITLEGDKDLSICPEAKYEEVGFKAINEKEEDLTEKVATKATKNQVTYKVEDDNKIFMITRNLIREDKEAPELKLNGNEHTYITINTNYNEQGATVNDKCDGDLSEKVEITGTVDTNTLGDYEINYKIVDKAGNESTAKRTVTVQKEIVRRNASLGCGEAGVIYLTFDDGPNNSTTTKILDILKKYDVKATFFVTNTNGGSDSQIKREFDEGHLVALHTNSHEYSQVYASDQAYWNDLNKISERVEKITGKKSMFVRFPGGSSNTVSRKYSSGIMSRLVNDVESKGYTYYDWNVDSRDAEGKNADQIYTYTTTGLSKSNGNVVLMHDIKQTTANALERVIQYAQSNGYTFKTLDKSITCHHKTAN